MKSSERWLWAIAIVILDLMIFAVPLTALAFAYILVVRPPQFKLWMDRMYE